MKRIEKWKGGGVADGEQWENHFLGGVVYNEVLTLTLYLRYWITDDLNVFQRRSAGRCCFSHEVHHYKHQQRSDGVQWFSATNRLSGFYAQRYFGSVFGDVCGEELPFRKNSFWTWNCKDCPERPFWTKWRMDCEREKAGEKMLEMLGDSRQLSYCAHCPLQLESISRVFFRWTTLNSFVVLAEFSHSRLKQGFSTYGTRTTVVRRICPGGTWDYMKFKNYVGLGVQKS